MRIVVTGGGGFIGRNLRLRLAEHGRYEVASVERNTTPDVLRSELSSADFVFHLAGVNRPKHEQEFDPGNRGFTATVCDVLRAANRRVPVAFASSTQAALDNPYGISKRASEDELRRYSADTGSPVYLYRLTNVFGKWCRPNYNSAVATFCYNVARGMPINVHDPAAPIRLIYIDDVISAWLRLLEDAPRHDGVIDVAPIYELTVGEVADLLQLFAESRRTLVTPRVGDGFVRALYATYLSYLPPAEFTYPLTRRGDQRGVFAEVLKTPDCGQFSFFTAHPGVTRGGHYHHTKNEKFLVLSGDAVFRFRHVNTGEIYEVSVSGKDSRIVETVPGWVHDITNIGDQELIVMLWANEVFDPTNADTYAAPVRA